MNKGTNAGVFFGLLGFAIFGFVFFMIFNVSFRMFSVVPVIIIILILFGVVGLMRNIQSGALEDRATLRTTCYSCKKHIPSGTKYCPHCGVDLYEEVICEYCGASNNASCSECNGLLK